MLAKRPDGSAIDSIKVNIHVKHSTTKDFNKELLSGIIEIKGGKLVKQLPTIPFNAKNLNIKVSFFVILTANSSNKNPPPPCRHESVPPFSNFFLIKITP